MKNKTLLILYDALNTPIIEENPFRSKKRHDLYNKFIDKYINPADEDAACDHLERLCEACQKSAFELGFYAAVELLHKS